MDTVIGNLMDVRKRAEDYTGADGLLHCGVCHEPKEAYFEDGLVVCGHDRYPVSCACRRRAEEEHEREEAEKKHRARVSELRCECFESDGMKKLRFGDIPEIPGTAGKICRNYAAHFEEAEQRGCGLLLWGGPGTGKSRAAACIANSLIDREISVRLTRPSVLANLPMSEIGGCLRRLSECRLMILDDFGAERTTALALERLYDAVDCRRRAGRPLIVTTDLSLETLKTGGDAVQRRIYSRILETTEPVRFAGEDLYGAGHAENRRWLGGIIG